MANPQKENGYTAFANDLLEAIMRVKLTVGELKVVLAIARETYGWSCKKTQLSYGDIARSVGIDKGNVFRACKTLSEKRLIFVQKTGRSNIIGINKNYDEWAVDNSSKSVVQEQLGVAVGQRGGLLWDNEKVAVGQRGGCCGTTPYIPKETVKEKRKPKRKEDVGQATPVDNSEKEKAGGNGKLEKKRVAEILKGFEEGIKSQDPRGLVDRFRDEGFEFTRVWGAIVQARTKRNPAGYLVTALGCGKYSVADSAMESAKREMRELNYF